jgi:plasmid stabilization system protein ParE
MTLGILSEAAEELYDAAAYYDNEQPGLELRLEAKFHQYIAWILENPEVPRLRRNKYRRVNLKVFPYYIAYVIREQQIQVVAFGHGHRRPEYRIDRTR